MPESLADDLRFRGPILCPIIAGGPTSLILCPTPAFQLDHFSRSNSVGASTGSYDHFIIELHLTSVIAILTSGGPTIDTEAMARDESRLIRGQKQGSTGHFLWRAQPTL